MTDTNGKKLEALRERERQIRAAIQKEQERQARRQRREIEKLQSMIGAAVMAYASESSDFRLMMKQTLGIVVTDERQRRYLAGCGWV